MQQLLILETIIKLACGLVLLAAPSFVIRLFGIAPAEWSFWPRLLGGSLIGIAAATYIEARLPGSKGLGLGGLIAINLTAAAVLFAILVMKGGAPSRRGRAALWLTIGLLVLLSLIEIADA
ncbi:MAG: ABC transporter permease [Hyphomicrobiaceae bacterium]|nr:ABC transporter permease [Hyphomicrobiaceae bacterium]